MKNFKIITIFLMLITSLILFLGCTKPKEPVIFNLQETHAELNVGDTYTPQLIIDNLEKYELEYKYEADIIRIEEGIIYCLDEGDCIITISIKDRNDIAPLSLTLYIYYVEPTKIICDEEIRICIDETYQLTPTFEPTNATPLLSYTTNNKKIVEVTEDGIIKGISVGQAQIIIKSELAKNINTRVLVIVEKQPVEKIEAIDSITLTYNETYQLEWTVLPEKSEQEVILEVEDSTIASITSDGLITAHKYGTTIIKIISIKDSSKYKEVNIKVEGDKATEVQISEENIKLQLGEEYKLNYTIIPSTAYQGLDIKADKDGIGVKDNIIIGEKVGNYILTLCTVDETNIKKIINVEVTGDETPIFVTNTKFDEQNILSWNEEFSELNNIKAYDDKDGDITNKIVLTGKVDNRRYGEYVLEYTITDSDGNTETLVRTINVIWDYDVTVIGHAGSYYGVPNSEEAILYAAEVLKYPAIEIDLKQTKDGVFVLSHDPVWGTANLEGMTYEELKNVEHKVTKNAGVVEGNLTEKQRTFTAKICTFERYLEICAEYNIIAVIELKTSSGISNWTEGNAPHTSKMPKIMELIKKHNMLDRVVFLSSQELCLNWVKTNGYEYIPCQYLTLSSCENENTYNIVKQYKLDISFNVRDGIEISDEWLEKYRALGCKLAVFTFEEYASYQAIQTWIDRGVDYVTTDWHVLDKLELPKSE